MIGLVFGENGMSSIAFHIPEEEGLDRRGIESLQRRKLAAMLPQVLGGNRFYQRKLAGIDFDPLRDPIQKLPFTTRQEIEFDQAENPLYGTNLTYPLERYCRYHQTSGSGGRPVRWLDTAESWNWFKKCWGTIYRAAGLRPEERLAFTFSFGPFIGFWAAFEAAVGLGNLCLPAGGMSTAARLKLILENRVNVICCTPTYALHMAEVAAADGINIADGAVRALIVAGEPGGSIPSTRQKIERGWNARVFDHTGMTEIGSLGFECMENPGGVHLIESECIAEVIDPQSGRSVDDGQAGELVLTNLGRWGSPLIRYRTRDQVRITRGKCRCGRHFARMEGGIIGRVDDMFIVRGNNVFPSAIEGIVRRFAEVAEFRVEAVEVAGLMQIRVCVEPVPGLADPCELCSRLARVLQSELNFRVDVRLVSPGTLPRFEMKSRRFVRLPAQTPAEACCCNNAATVKA